MTSHIFPIAISSNRGDGTSAEGLSGPLRAAQAHGGHAKGRRSS